MKDTTYYLDQVRALTETKSDYAVAKMIGISRQAMSKYKAGRMTLDGDTALIVGELLDVDPVEIICNVKASKARGSQARRLWSDLAKKHSGAAASLIMGLCLTLGSAIYSPSNQAHAAAPAYARLVDRTIHYAQLLARWIVGIVLHENAQRRRVRAAI